MEGEGCAASVREAAATPEGRAALRAWAARLHAGSDVLAAAEERTVSCILSAWRPVIVETRDNLSRRLAGPAFSNAFYRLSANPFFQVFFGMWTVLIAAVCPLCAVGVLSPQVALFVWTIEFMCFSSTWALFSWPLLVIIWQRWDFWYLMGHTVVVAFGGASLFSSRLTGLVWLLMYFCFIPACLVFDSTPARKRAFISYASLLCSMIAMVAGLYFRLFDLTVVELPMLGDKISMQDRVYSSLITIAAFIGRFAVTVYWRPDDFVMLRGAMSKKIPRAAADDIMAAHARLMGVILSSNYGGAPTAVAPAPTPNSIAGLLTQVARAALRESGGDHAAARELLLRQALLALDEDMDKDKDKGSADSTSILHSPSPYASRHWRRETVMVHDQLVATWQCKGAGGELVRVLLPCPVPVIVDASRNVAAAVGGKRLSDACFAVCRNRAVNGFAFALSIFGYPTLVYVLCSGDKGWGLMALWFLTAATMAINVLQSGLLNTTVLQEVVLWRWDTWFAITNTYIVAVTGMFILSDYAHGAAWFCTQFTLSFYYFQDAMPPSRRSRLITSIALGLYAAFQIGSCFAIWLKLYLVGDPYVSVVGQQIRVRRVCFTALANAALLSLRFAYRALSSQDNLM